MLSCFKDFNCHAMHKNNSGVNFRFKFYNCFFKGGLAVAVPGELLGLWEAHQSFGTVEWSELVKFSRELAQNGFEVSEALASSLKHNEKPIRADPGLR